MPLTFAVTDLPQGLDAEDLKAEIRSRVRLSRLERSDRLRRDAAHSMAERILGLDAVQKASCVSVYASRPHEPGTGPLIEELAARGVRVLIPVLGDGLQRGWAVYHGTDDVVVRAPGRPPEPSGECLPSSALGEADVVVVPALAADAAGTRLGQGGGWYDRALLEAKPDVPVIAMVFDGEFLGPGKMALPRERHDFPVTAVATPTAFHEIPA